LEVHSLESATSLAVPVVPAWRAACCNLLPPQKLLRFKLRIGSQDGGPAIYRRARERLAIFGHEHADQEFSDTL
jgi:hypothetical protein